MIIASTALAAAREYIARQAGLSRPAGDLVTVIDQQRWYPDHESEEKWCCQHAGIPSHTDPLMLLRHCRSIEHIAEMYDVSEADIRQAARILSRQAGDEAVRLINRVQKRGAK